MGGKQTIRMRSKGGYGGAMMPPVVGSPMGAPMVGYPVDPLMETTIVHPPMPMGSPMSAPMGPGPAMMPPPLPAGYVESSTTTYPAMGMVPTATTMGGVIPNNNRWTVTVKSRGNTPPVGLPAGTVAPYYSGNERFTYKARQRSGGLFSRGPKSSVTIKERNRGAGIGGATYYGGSVMPMGSTVSTMPPPMMGAPMPPMYEEEVIQQYPYAAASPYTSPYIGG